MNSESQKKIFRLSQLASAIHRALDNATGGQSYWVKAEISQWKVSNSGHAYLDLVEMHHGQKAASLSAVIWQNELSFMRQRLKGDFEQIFKQGSEIVCKCNIEFHPVFGLKLRIIDIDLSFTLGALEQRKRQTLQRLREENLINRNRELPIPIVIQRIALLTAPGSAAWKDFTEHLLRNEFGYTFKITTYAVPVQGSQSAMEISKTLLAIPCNEFDVIAIIRGGGSTLDLDGFNDYELCKTTALCPIPVLSGIGHESDQSLLDIVAGLPHKTPTAVADFIIDHMHEFESQIRNILANITRLASQRISRDTLIMENVQSILKRYPTSNIHRKRGDLHNISSRILRLSAEYIHDKKQSIQKLVQNIEQLSMLKIKQTEKTKLAELQNQLHLLSKHQLQNLQRQMIDIQQSIELIRPEKSLARGFSISRKDQKAIKFIDQIALNDSIHTTLFHGSFESIVTKINKP
jgi:exodeoxyribonuclease VII large subunit